MLGAQTGFMDNKKILFMYGQTASGKTEFASQLAAYLPIEIVNMDSAQCYTPLTIGTSKPDWKTSDIRQHLFDCIDEPKVFTVHTYRQKVLSLVESIWSRSHIPVFVGGSGFYLKNLLFPIEDFDIKNQDIASIACKEKEENSSLLWQQLNNIDPERAQKIHPHDVYRVKRALDIWYATGKKPSLYKPLYNPLAPFILIKINRKREDLYKRINQRTEIMLKEGWLDEVRSLLSTDWEVFVKKKGFIGYSELIDHLHGLYTLEELIPLIQKQTRHYAKRQQTFWHMLEKIIVEAERKSSSPIGQIIEFDLTSSDVHLYIKQLLRSF